MRSGGGAIWVTALNVSQEDLGLWPTAKYLDQARALRANAPVDQLTVLGEDRHLTFPLPQVHANMFHG